MGKQVHKILCVSTLVIMLFPLQQWFHLFKFAPLSGVTTEVQLSPFTLANIKFAQWQTSLESYLKQHIGFRECLIRMHNQYRWTFFNKSSVKNILVGKNQYLYENYFVEDHYQSLMYNYTESPQEMIDMFRKQSMRLSKVQQILDSCGVRLFVTIPPGKDIIYPQYLPSAGKYVKPLGPRAINYYPFFFDSCNVRFINICQWFNTIKDTVSYQIMPKYGTHWSNIAAVYAFDSIMRYMEQISGIDITDITLLSPYYDAPKNPDNDLEELLNLMFSLPAKPNQYVPVVIEQPKKHPRLIVIGDSFFRNIINSFQLEALFDWHYWYYNSTHYSYQSDSKVDHSQLVSELLQSQFVMLNYCTSKLYDLGNGFITRALVNLCYSPQEVEQAIQKIIQSIENTPEWRNQIQEKAQNQNKSFVEVEREDAEYILYTTPERYFPDLQQSGIPQISNPMVLQRMNNK